MWIIPAPTTLPLSAQASGDSTSALASPDPTRVSSCTSSGKPTPAKFWRRAWKAGRFPRLQYGATLPLLTLTLGVESWISLLAETRANPTATQENVREKTTTDGFSTMSLESSRACGLQLSSVRTCRGISRDNSGLSSLDWSDWATALREEYSRRKRSAQLTTAPGCTLWERPTVAAANGTRKNRGGDRSDELLLTGQAVECSRRFSPRRLSLPSGRALSVDGRILNPRLAEMILGLPIGWTRSGPGVMQFAHWLQRSRTRLSKLLSATTIDGQLF